MIARVIQIQSNDSLKFDNGFELYSNHDQSCCESHYLSFSDLSLDDFDGLKFDLSKDNFFERVKGYGIALKPVNGWPVRIPGYGSNNGYYSDNLELILWDGKNEDSKRIFDITECQYY